MTIETRIEAPRRRFFSRPTEPTEPITPGAAIRIIRQLGGLDIADLAGLAGISESYLSLLERGKRPLSQERYLQLRSILTPYIQGVATSLGVEA